MKTFEAWLADGPLVGEFFTPEQRSLMKIAYLEGAGAAFKVSQDEVAQLLPPHLRAA